MASAAAKPEIFTTNSGGIPNRFANASPGALVIGGAHGSLGVVRSLGRRGIPVWLLTDGNPIARFSRFARTSSAWPGPNDNQALKYLLTLADQNDLKGWVLFPGGDAEARFISLHRRTLEEFFRLTTPEWKTLEWASNKTRTYQLAGELGIACPKTFRARRSQELFQQDLRFPLILKPTSRNATNAFTQAKAWRVDNADELRARYDQAVSLVGAESVLIQELIPGNGSCQFSYAAVCDRGRPLASMTAVRRRQYPIDFGFTSTFVQSVNNLEVERLARLFLEALAYSGMVEVEFKYDRRDNRYKLLDVNARTWAWVPLGGKAGVDFPWIMWQLALGNAVEEVRGTSGVAWTHLSRDLFAGMAEVRAGSLTWSEYFKSFAGVPLEFAAFANDDLLPALMDLPVTLWRARARRL